MSKAREHRPEPLQKLLDRLAAKFPSQAAFANAIGIHPSHLSKALRGRGDTFDIARCLRIADATHENPSVVLRAAGRGDIADLIEKLYGEPRGQEERVIVDAINDLAPAEREAFTALLKRAAAKTHTTTVRKLRVG